MIPKKIGGVEEATPLDFRFFQLFDLHPEVHAPRKNRSSKDLQTFFSGHKACSFFGKKSRGPGRSTSLEEDERMLQSRFWRFGLRDLHRLMLEGWFWMGFLLSQNVSWCFFFFRFPHSCHPVAVLLRLTCGKDGKKMHSM